MSSCEEAKFYLTQYSSVDNEMKRDKNLTDRITVKVTNFFGELQI